MPAVVVDYETVERARESQRENRERERESGRAAQEKKQGRNVCEA